MTRRQIAAALVNHILIDRMVDGEWVTLGSTRLFQVPLPGAMHALVTTPMMAKQRLRSNPMVAENYDEAVAMERARPKMEMGSIDIMPDAAGPKVASVRYQDDGATEVVAWQKGDWWKLVMVPEAA